MATAHKNETRSNWEFAFYLEGTWAESIQVLRGRIPDDEPLCFTEVSFFRGDLSDADLSLAHCQRSDFSCATLVGIKFCRALLDGTDFTHSYLDNADFSRAQLKRAKLVHVTLKGTNFSNADLYGCTIQAKSYKGANFSDARLTEVVFPDANYSALAEATGWETSRGLDPVIFNAICNAGYVPQQSGQATVASKNDESKAAPR